MTREVTEFKYSFHHRYWNLMRCILGTGSILVFRLAFSKQVKVVCWIYIYRAENVPKVNVIRRTVTAWIVDCKYETNEDRSTAVLSPTGTQKYDTHKHSPSTCTHTNTVPLYAHTQTQSLYMHTHKHSPTTCAHTTVRPNRNTCTHTKNTARPNRNTRHTHTHIQCLEMTAVTSQ